MGSGQHNAHHRKRDAKGRFMPVRSAPSETASLILSQAFKRHIAAITQRLSYDYAKLHCIKVRFISFRTKLKIRSCAHLSARLEVLREQASDGVEVNDLVLARLSAEHRQHMRDLGFPPDVLEPPKARPVKPLSHALRQHGVLP